MRCSDFDKDKYKILKLPHPLMIHWILNPGLAFNEIILGQRMPKVLLIEKQKEKTLIKRSMVPCPYCCKIHNGRLWSGKNAFGHWFGYICPSCGQIIPCLWNLVSLATLVVMFPIWILAILIWKKNWIEYEKRRLQEKPEKEPAKIKSIQWLIMGACGFGGTMWIIIALIPGLLRVIHGEPFGWRTILIQLPIFVVGGLLFGAVMKFFTEKNPDPHLYKRTRKAK